MKALWFLVSFAVGCMVWQVAYHDGQREMRQFEAVCAAPGVQCVVRFRPEYLEKGVAIDLPENVWAEFYGIPERVQ